MLHLTTLHIIVNNHKLTLTLFITFLLHFKLLSLMIWFNVFETILVVTNDPTYTAPPGGRPPQRPTAIQMEQHAHVGDELLNLFTPCISVITLT